MHRRLVCIAANRCCEPRAVTFSIPYSNQGYNSLDALIVRLINIHVGRYVLRYMLFLYIQEMAASYLSEVGTLSLIVC